MRWLLAVLLLSILPVAAAHDGEHECRDANAAGLNHLTLWNGTVPADAEQLIPTAFNGCALLENWWVLYWIDSDGPVTITIVNEGVKLASVVVDGTEVLHIQMPATGFPEIHLSNMAEAEAGVRLYFDQTCECSVKGSPVPGGPFWFNTDAAAGDEVTFRVQVVPIWTELSNETAPPARIELQLAHVQPSTTGPTGSGIVLAFDTTTDSCGEPVGRFIGCGSHTFTSDGGTQYLLGSTTHDGDARWSIQVRPEIIVDEQAPALGWPWFLVALALVAARR